MQVTEEEAKAKTCPFTFTVAERRDHDGVGIREGGPWNCIASACMAWRRGPTSWPQFHFAGDTMAIAEPSRPDGTPPEWEWRPFSADDPEENAGWLEPKASAKARQPGFCGLAGAPQS